MLSFNPQLKYPITALFLGGVFFLSAAIYANNDFFSQRKKMVEEQIVRRGIKDKRVLEAFLKVPRHEFVSSSYKNLSYSDTPLPIGYGQTISQPYIVALMTELLQLKGREKVLEIGTGSGYQTAILAELAKEVYTVEILEPLARRAEENLKQMNYRNVKVKCGNGFLGWQEYAPFDAIIVTCAPKSIPPALITQLGEGGRMVIPVGERWQELKLVIKKKGKVEVRDIITVRFVPMVRELQ
jgi:protein-L-isoaspartate(D-aspartate) O-methyltransferase